MYDIEQDKESKVKKALIGHIKIPTDLWPKIPPGSDIKYFTKGTEARFDRFKYGGVVKSNFKKDDGKSYLTIQTVNSKYFRLDLAEAAEIYKKIDQDMAFNLMLIIPALRPTDLVAAAY